MQNFSDEDYGLVTDQIVIHLMRLLSVAHGMLQDCKIIKFSEVETGSLQGVLIVITNKNNTLYISSERPVLLQFNNLPYYLTRPPRQICNSGAAAS